MHGISIIIYLDVVAFVVHMPYIDPMGLSQLCHFQEDSTCLFNRDILGVRLYIISNS